MPVQANPGSPLSVQGKEVSFAEAALTANFGTGEEHPITAFKDVSWKSTVAVGKGAGPGGVPKYRGSGVASYTLSTILYRGGKKLLYRALAGIAKEAGLVRDGDKVQIGLVEWDLVLRYSYPGQDEISTVVCERCRLIDDDEKSSEGEALQEATLGLDTMEIYEVDTETGDKWVLR